jgi:hypothetical protein
MVNQLSTLYNFVSPSIEVGQNKHGFFIVRLAPIPLDQVMVTHPVVR